MKDNKMSVTDALCILELGWSNQEEKDLYIKARNIVTNHGKSVRLRIFLDRLEEEKQ